MLHTFDHCRPARFEIRGINGPRRRAAAALERCTGLRLQGQSSAHCVDTRAWAYAKASTNVLWGTTLNEKRYCGSHAILVAEHQLLDGIGPAAVHQAGPRREIQASRCRPVPPRTYNWTITCAAMITAPDRRAKKMRAPRQKSALVNGPQNPTRYSGENVKGEIQIARISVNFPALNRRVCAKHLWRAGGIGNARDGRRSDC
jgi:hypothetical protein